MNPQEIYDTVKEHLLTQMEESMHPVHKYCMYRNPSGLKCAVGCLIPDELYDPRMDNGGVSGKGLSLLLQEFSLPEWMLKNSGLLHALQRVHDATEPDAWREGLQTVARTYGLET